MVDKVSTRSANLRSTLFNLLTSIPDPEIPVINIVELGIVRDVIVDAPKAVVITPTYTGCPATQMIARMIREKLDANGFETVDIKTQLSPAWTTDWIAKQAKEKLKAYGIDPPASSKTPQAKAACPRCGAQNAKLISEFGSTPCKSLYACKDCFEPFDKFKCH